MPKPRSGESRDKWISRCMGDAEQNRSFPERNQRFAVCNSLWENRDMSLPANCQLLNFSQLNFAEGEFPSFLPPLEDGHKRVKKDCLTVNKWRHPEAGWELNVSPKELVEMAKTANQMIKDGIKIPAPLDHRSGAEHNIGYWSGFWTTGEGNNTILMGALDVANQEWKDKIGTTIKEVSVRIQAEYEGSTNNQKYKNALVHVSPCLYPVVTGQNNFETIAASGAKDGWLTFFSERENSMDKLKDFAKSLGIEIKDDMDEDKLLSLINEKIKGKDDELKSLSKKVEELTEQVKKINPPKKDDRDSWPQEAKEKIEALEASQKNAYVKDVNHRVEKVLKEGKAVPADIEAIGLDKVDVEKISLSRGGIDPVIEGKLTTLEALQKRHTLTKDLSRQDNDGSGDEDEIKAAERIAKEDLASSGFEYKSKEK